jgi:hypothetical protein
MPGPYQTARAFRAAREDRLNQQARQEHLDVTRLRRLVAFERLLARLFLGEDPAWLLKGGYACHVPPRRMRGLAERPRVV